MDVEYNLVTEQDIEDFADAQDTPLILVIDEQPVDRPEVERRYRAYFKYTTLKQGSAALNFYGSGDTINSAVEDYADGISDNTIIYSNPIPVEIEVPTLTVSSNYNP